MATTYPDFNHSTTATEVAGVFSHQIKNKVILITGCSSNTIGSATALAFAPHGPSLLILAGRSQSKLDAVVTELQAAAPLLKARTLILDLGNMASVRKAAAEVNAWDLPKVIDLLINNAGIMAVESRTMTDDGLEVQLATNHVGHFLFTNLILEKFKAAAAGNTEGRGVIRVINVSSLGHIYSPFRFNDYNFSSTSARPDLPSSEEPDWEALKRRGETLPAESDTKPSSYQRMIAYGQSKTANILFSVGLKQCFRNSIGVDSFALHPGAVMSTGGAPHLKKLDPKLIASLKSIDQGAATTLVAALDPGLSGSTEQVYLSDCQFGEVKEWATDPEMAARLWTLSEQIVGQKF